MGGIVKESAFTLLRGIASGRIVPSRYDAGSGEHVFVLGDESAGSIEALCKGDYVEVKQSVDLTGVDLVVPNFRTVGVALDDFVEKASFPRNANDCGRWNMRKNWTHAQNENIAGPHLLAEGDLEVDTETYSANEEYCRRIPVGSMTARLTGENNPQLWTGELNQYTLLLFCDFLAGEYLSRGGSAGKSLTIFDATDGVNGIRVHMLGLSGVGVNQWNIAVTHWHSGVMDTQIFPGYTWETSQGFRSIAVRYSADEAGSNRLRLYVDGVFVGAVAATPAFSPGEAQPGAPIHIGSPGFWGRLSQVQLIAEACSDATIAACHNIAVGPNRVEQSQWRMEVLVDGNSYAHRAIAEGEEKTINDFRVPVAAISGVHDVAFRLTYTRV